MSNTHGITTGSTVRLWKTRLVLGRVLHIFCDGDLWIEDLNGTVHTYRAREVALL